MAWLSISLNSQVSVYTTSVDPATHYAMSMYTALHSSRLGCYEPGRSRVRSVLHRCRRTTAFGSLCDLGALNEASPDLTILWREETGAAGHSTLLIEASVGLSEAPGTLRSS